VTLAQVLLLLLLAFAPVALVAGAIPGRGHDFFRGWLTRLTGFLLRKAAYSLILAVLLAVNAALAEATSNLGWLLSFGLQALLFWAVFVYRHQLTGQLLAATTGSGQAAAGRFTTLYYGGQLAVRPVRTAGRLARRSLRALRGGPDRPPKPPEAPPPAPRSQTTRLAAFAGARDRPGVADQTDSTMAADRRVTDREESGERASPQAAGTVGATPSPPDPGERDLSSAPSPHGEPAPPDEGPADRPRGEHHGKRPAPPEGAEHARPQRQQSERERPSARTGQPGEARPPAATDEPAPSPGRRRPGESPLASELRGDRHRLEGERRKDAASPPEPESPQGGSQGGGQR
jgi:hypothetical protein